MEGKGGRMEGKKTGRERKIESHHSIMEKLSRDLIIDIISRLPIKYVLRCKSVSKSWEALLSDPLFAAAHFNRASTLTPFSNYIISETYPGKLLYFIETEEEDNETSTISKPKHLNFPFVTDRLTGFTHPIFMGSCLGYVCFSARYLPPGGTACLTPTNPMYLFNPITGANILLPQFEETRFFTCVHGFGLDVSTQECKVVLVYLYQKTFSVQVHTVGRDYSWRTNTVPSMLPDVSVAELTMGGHLETSLPLGFNGSIHWIVLSSVDKNDRSGPKRACILSFQLDTEVVGVIPMPEPLQVMKPCYRNTMMYALQVCGGCLSIIYSPEPYFVDMWVMADYKISKSWVKYTIQQNCMRGYQISPIGFRKNGELMLLFDNEGLVSYNIDNDRYKILRSCTTIPFPFVGSLISLKSAYRDSEVAGTSGFGNPIQKQQ